MVKRRPKGSRCKNRSFGSKTRSIDYCIDGDGIATSGRGAFSVTAGTVLATWPTGQKNEGIDSFNHPGGVWSNAVGGSDIHLEDPTGSCGSLAQRDAFHDLGLDCVVLDLNTNLVDQQPVSCDFETGSSFAEPCPAFVGPLSVKYVDANANAQYDNGEDIIQ